jgi:hypothetical protein
VFLGRVFGNVNGCEQFYSVPHGNVSFYLIIIIYDPHGIFICCLSDGFNAQYRNAKAECKYSHGMTFSSAKEDNILEPYDIWFKFTSKQRVWRNADNF